MKKTIEEATAMIKEQFGTDAEFPMITIAGAINWGSEYSIEYFESEWMGRKERKIHVTDVETVWEIDMVTGEIFHSGYGAGCFWAYYGCLAEEEEE